MKPTTKSSRVSNLRACLSLFVLLVSCLVAAFWVPVTAVGNPKLDEV